jgi:HlyD family secretion protein
LELAQAGMERTRLRAPTAGQVLQRQVEVGQVVRPGDVLFQYATRGPLQVRVTPDEYHLGALLEGQEAQVVVEAFPDRPLRARVDWIAPQIDPARGTVEVRLALADEVDATQLLPDMSATVEVLLGERDDALVLPTWLVRDLGTGTPWVLVAEAGTATRRNVSLGLLGDEAVEIGGGLDADDEVIPIDAGVDVDDPVRTRPVRPALSEG